MVAEEEKRQPKPKATVAAKKDEKIDRVYLCPNQTSQSFYIPLRDKDGKFVPNTDRQGLQKYVRGVPQYIDQLCRFETVSAGTKKNPGKVLCIYTLKADDPQYDDKFKELERLRADQSSWVMDQAQYDKWRNPDAAEYKAENEVLRAENAKSASVIAEMEKRIKELEKPVSEK